MGIGPGASRKASNVARVRSPCSGWCPAVSGSLLADALDVVVGSENPDRRVNMVEIDDQLAKHGANVRDLAGDAARQKDERPSSHPDHRACTAISARFSRCQGIRSFGRRAVARVSPFMRSTARC